MKQTIVMIHGMWGTAHVWDRFKQYFAAAGYQCITPVLRYHDVPPGSPPNPSLGRTSLLDYVKDLEAELSKLTSKPIIMGHSMGGLLAQMLGERGLAESLVLLSPAPPAGLEIFNMSSARTFLSEMLTPGFWNNVRRSLVGTDRGYASAGMLQRVTHRPGRTPNPASTAGRARNPVRSRSGVGVRAGCCCCLAFDAAGYWRVRFHPYWQVGQK